MTTTTKFPRCCMLWPHKDCLPRSSRWQGRVLSRPPHAAGRACGAGGAGTCGPGPCPRVRLHVGEAKRRIWAFLVRDCVSRNRANQSHASCNGCCITDVKAIPSSWASPPSIPITTTCKRLAFMSPLHQNNTAEGLARDRTVSTQTTVHMHSCTHLQSAQAGRPAQSCAALLTP